MRYVLGGMGEDKQSGKTSLEEVTCHLSYKDWIEVHRQTNRKGVGAAGRENEKGHFVGRLSSLCQIWEGKILLKFSGVLNLYYWEGVISLIEAGKSKDRLTEDGGTQMMSLFSNTLS